MIEDTVQSKSEGKSEERVEVNRSALEKLISRVDKLESENKKLLEISDRGRLAHYESTHQTQSPKIYRLSVIDGKIVTSWKMVTNQVWKDELGKWREKQEIGVILEDGSSMTLPYVEFTNKTEKVEVSLVSVTQKGGKTYLELETAAGAKLVVDSVFVN